MPITNDTPLKQRTRNALMDARRARVRVLLTLLFCATVMPGANPTSAASVSRDTGNPTAAADPIQSNFRTAEATPMPTTSAGPVAPLVIISDLNDYADDNIAILMLLRSGKADIRGIITTSGNVCSDRAAAEAGRLLGAAGAVSIPVVRGFPLAWHEERRKYYEHVQKPLRPVNAYAGALGSDVSCGREPNGPGDQSDAADFLIEQARAATGGLTIILIGPATVLAEAARRDPRLPDVIRQVYAMGGAIRVAGNVTPHAEFNVWFDPEAMASVLALRSPVTLVPLDATEQVTYEPFALPEKPIGFSATHLAAYLEKARSRRVPARMWDEVLAAVVIDPSLIESVEDIFLTVSINKDERYGEMLSASAPADLAARPVRVVTKIRADGVRQLVRDLLLGRE